MAKKRVLLLGSTGSIGENTDKVVQNLAEELELVGLAAHSSWERLLEQIASHHPEAVALVDPEAAGKLRTALENTADKAGALPRIYEGEEGLVELVRETEADVLVAAISGAAGLPANIAALETGKDLALANKESLVMSGSILTRLARENDRRILPVDSEHSAIFQSLEAGSREEVERVILTASGGPFRQTSAEELEKVTRQDALNHPTWEMGEKITIDSATLMNKALEIIEARWLFDLPPEQIEVVVHPQSIVHSMVTFSDGATIAQLSRPDMRLCMGYALAWPDRLDVPYGEIDWSEAGRLDFEPPDRGAFPCLDLAFAAGREGETAPAWLSAANEVAVEAFLDGALSWVGISELLVEALDSWTGDSADDLETVLDVDRRARVVARSLIAART